MFQGEAAAERCVAGGIGEYKPGGTGNKLPEALRALLLEFLACLQIVVKPEHERIVNRALRPSRLEKIEHLARQMPAPTDALRRR